MTKLQELVSFYNTKVYLKREALKEYQSIIDDELNEKQHTEREVLLAEISLLKNILTELVDLQPEGQF